MCVKFRILNYTFQKNIEIQFWGKSHYIISGYFFTRARVKKPKEKQTKKKPTNKCTKAPEKSPTLSAPSKNNPTTKHGNTNDGMIWMAHPGECVWTKIPTLYKELRSYMQIDQRSPQVVGQMASMTNKAPSKYVFTDTWNLDCKLSNHSWNLR